METPLGFSREFNTENARIPPLFRKFQNITALQFYRSLSINPFDI